MIQNLGTVALLQNTNLFFTPLLLLILEFVPKQSHHLSAIAIEVTINELIQRRMETLMAELTKVLNIKSVIGDAPTK